MDLTDKELYCVVIAIKSHINNRNVYWTKQSLANFNRMKNKVITEGLKRKEPKKILHPIIEFNE